MTERPRAGSCLTDCLTFVACILHVREYQIPPIKFGAKKSANFISKKKLLKFRQASSLLLKHWWGMGGGAGFGSMGTAYRKVEANPNAVVSGSYQNYQNGGVIDQLTDIGRGESVVCSKSVAV
jgi:hypothetical protein